MPFEPCYLYNNSDLTLNEFWKTVDSAIIIGVNLLLKWCKVCHRNMSVLFKILLLILCLLFCKNIIETLSELNAFLRKFYYVLWIEFLLRKCISSYILELCRKMDFVYRKFMEWLTFQEQICSIKWTPVIFVINEFKDFFRHVCHFCVSKVASRTDD